MATGLVYELIKEGKDERIEEVDFFQVLREFDGREVTISISEDQRVLPPQADDLEEED